LRQSGSYSSGRKSATTLKELRPIRPGSYRLEAGMRRITTILMSICLTALITHRCVLGIVPCSIESPTAVEVAAVRA
jgi:hypothetical protein